MANAALPDGYHSVNTIINVPDAEGLIHFLEATFEATQFLARGTCCRTAGSGTRGSASATRSS